MCPEHRPVSNAFRQGSVKLSMRAAIRVFKWLFVAEYRRYQGLEDELSTT